LLLYASLHAKPGLALMMRQCESASSLANYLIRLELIKFVPYKTILNVVKSGL